MVNYSAWNCIESGEVLNWLSFVRKWNAFNLFTPCAQYAQES